MYFNFAKHFALPYNVVSTLKRKATGGTTTHKSARDLIHHDSLWKIHCVCYCQNDQLCIRFGWPIKQMIQNLLLLSPKKIQLHG